MHHRVVRCTVSSSGLRIDAAFGSLGELECEFKAPNGVAVRGDTLYVVEIGNTRLQSLRLPSWELQGSVGTRPQCHRRHS